MTYFYRVSGLIAALLFLVTGCATLPVKYTPGSYGRGSIVAIWDLENYSITRNAVLDDIQDFLTAKVAETLEQEGGYVLVERQKLLQMLEELHLGSSALSDKSSRLQVGRLLGAQLMVFGGFQKAGDQLRIDLRLVEVESGAVIRTGKRIAVASDISALLTTAEAVARELL